MIFIVLYTTYVFLIEIDVIPLIFTSFQFVDLVGLRVINNVLTTISVRLLIYATSASFYCTYFSRATKACKLPSVRPIVNLSIFTLGIM